MSNSNIINISLIGGIGASNRVPGEPNLGLCADGEEDVADTTLGDSSILGNYAPPWFTLLNLNWMIDFLKFIQKSIMLEYQSLVQ